MSEPAPSGGVLDALFAVLADPTRRRIVERLVHDGPHTATQLAVDSAITRQAIVKHLQSLADVGLVAPERVGREVRYRATTDQLADAVDWLLRTSGQWDDRLERLQRRVGAKRSAARSAPE